MNLSYIKNIVEPVVSEIINSLESPNDEIIDAIYSSSIISYLVASGYTPNMAIKVYNDFKNTNPDTTQ